MVDIEGGNLEESSIATSIAISSGIGIKEDIFNDPGVIIPIVERRSDSSYIALIKATRDFLKADLLIGQSIE